MIEKRPVIGSQGRYLLTEQGDVYENTPDGLKRISTWVEGVNYQRVQLCLNGYTNWYNVSDLIKQTYPLEKVKPFAVPDSRHTILNPDQVRQIVFLLSQGELNAREIADKFQININHVFSIKHGRSWTSISGFEKRASKKPA